MNSRQLFDEELNMMFGAINIDQRTSHQRSLWARRSDADHVLILREEKVVQCAYPMPGASVDKNGKWWPPYGWANGVGCLVVHRLATESGPEPGCVGSPRHVVP